MICPNCGKVYGNRRDTCPRCGMPRGFAAEEPSDNRLVNTAQQMTDQGSPEVISPEVSRDFGTVNNQTVEIRQTGENGEQTVQQFASQEDAREALEDLQDRTGIVFGDAIFGNTQFPVSGGNDSGFTNITSEMSGNDQSVEIRESDGNGGENVQVIQGSEAVQQKYEEFKQRVQMEFGKTQMPASQIVSDDNRKDYTGRPDITYTVQDQAQPQNQELKFGCGVIVLFFVLNQLFLFIPGIAAYVSQKMKNPDYAKKVLMLTIVQIILDSALITLLVMIKKGA